MPLPVIETAGISKRYRLGAIGPRSLREMANGWVARMRGEPPSREESEFWALRDVSFSIQPGEVVGIIGRNGAGKSTLLKILSRITEPTSGRAVIRGRVASLLEVGTGFHPELTGRENAFLNGAILGMTREEIRRKFDEIVAFAEVENFIDTPVKRYSSGMYVRLAFAVAAHLEPEILIVDEVLAVGDAQFQKKCFGKMQDVSGREGRTILFVSHNMAALRNICRSGVLLDRGRVAFIGTADAAIDRYLKENDVSASSVVWSGPEAPGTSEVLLRQTEVIDNEGKVTSALDHRQSFTLVVHYEVKQSIKNLIVGFDLQNAEGTLVCGSNNVEATATKIQRPGRYRTECRFPGHLFNEGRYLARFAFHTLERNLFVTNYCLAINIADLHGHGPGSWKLHGILRPQLQWHLAEE